MALQTSFKQFGSVFSQLCKPQTSSSAASSRGALASLADLAKVTGLPFQLSATTAAHTDAGPSDGSLTKARKLAVGVGVFAGIFGGLVGLGGGVLISPIIANACRSLPQRVITGTSLAAVTSTSITATLVYSSHGLVDPMAALILTCGAVFTSPLGARATRLFDCNALRSLTGYWCYFVSPLLPIKMWIFSHLAPAAVAGSVAAGSSSVAAAAATSALVIAASGAALAVNSPTLEHEDLSPGAAQHANKSSAVPAAMAVSHGTSGQPASIGTTAAGDESSSSSSRNSSISSNTSSNSSRNSNSVGRIRDDDSTGAGASKAVLPQSMLAWLKRHGMRDLEAADASYLGTGAVAGFASGLLGVGGGTIMVPLIAMFHLEMTQAQIVATSLAAMIIPSIAGLAQHAALGNVDVKMAAGLVLGTLVGGFVGSTLGVQAPPGVLEAAFSLGMLLLGRKTLQNVARAKAAAAAVAAKVL